MARRPTLPMGRKWAAEFLAPRGPRNVPPVHSVAPNFVLPFAQYFIDADGESRVRYGEMMRLDEHRGHPVLLSLTRIVSDRFF